MSKIINLKRRRLLQFTGSLLLSNLNAGCTLRSFPSNKIDQIFPNSTAIDPVLRPGKTGSITRPSSLKFCLDVHTHFFNASDINVEGYLKGSVAHSIPDKKLRYFAVKMSPVLDMLAEMAPKAYEEYDFLITEMAKPSKDWSMIESNPMDEVADKFRKNLASEIFEKMKKLRLDKDYQDLNNEHKRFKTLMIPNQVTEEFSEQTVLDAIDPLSRRRKGFQSYNNFYSTIDERSSVEAMLEFIGHMLSYRWMSLRSYQQIYTEGDGAFGIDGVFSALVDFDYFLDSPPRSSREDQVKLHSLLSLLSGGYMLPLVGYNPWTDIERHDESIRLVKCAIKKYGFVGVKIYPPIGYFPFGNAELPIKSESRPKDLKLLDSKLKALFTWCADNGIPVMAHTGKTMGKDDPSDGFAKPDGWKHLFNQFIGKRSPIINAGHFGGDLPKDSKFPNEWPKQFAKLAKQPPGDHFYGDLGYWSALTSCKPMSKECNTAIGRIQAALTENPMMTNRIMYGSDWFMLSREPNAASYPNQIAENLDSLKPTIPIDALFYHNAINCFGLGKDGIQRNRILSRFKDVSGGIPDWLQNI